MLLVLCAFGSTIIRNSLSTEEMYVAENSELLITYSITLNF